MLRLSVPQPGILPPPPAAADGCPAGRCSEHQKLVAEAAGGPPVTDLDRGASAGDVTEAAVHPVLPHRIQRRRWVRPATCVLYSARAIISFRASPPEVMTTRLAPPPAGNRHRRWRCASLPHPCGDVIKTGPYYKHTPARQANTTCTSSI